MLRLHRIRLALRMAVQASPKITRYAACGYSMHGLNHRVIVLTAGRCSFTHVRMRLRRSVTTKQNIRTHMYVLTELS